jgi:hypothetical protein
MNMETVRLAQLVSGAQSREPGADDRDSRLCRARGQRQHRCGGGGRATGQHITTGDFDAVAARRQYALGGTPLSPRAAHRALEKMHERCSGHCSPPG